MHFIAYNIVTGFFICTKGVLMSCVYKHTFPNGAVYIGRTNMKPEDRWLNGWGYRNCPLMFAAILQFGWNNVEHEILADNITEEESKEIEYHEIVMHSDSCTVYNIQGIPAQVLAQESAHYIDPHSTLPHYPTKLSTQKRYKDYIIPLTQKPPGTHTCRIDVYASDGTYICTYPSAKVASQELNVNHGDIISCCKGVKSDGKPRYQVKGYIFRYNLKEKEVG